MTQATDLGIIANQLAQQYRTRVNVNIQALATQHYGATAPTQMYPCMVWFCSGDGYIKIRNPTNTAWENIGLIGPPMKWFNVDIPSTGWRTGDVKVTAQASETGWVTLNDGTVGDQYSGATTRANPDTAALFALLWGAGGLPLYVAGTWTQVGRGASAAADYAAHRHLQLPWVLGRALASQGQGAGLTQRWWLASDGDEYVQLADVHLPAHYHTTPAHQHAITQMVDNMGVNTGNAFQYNAPADLRITSGVTEMGGGGVTGWAGSNHAHPNVGPRVYFYFLMKL